MEEADTAQQAHTTEVEESKKEFEAVLEKQKLQFEIQVAEAKVGNTNLDTLVILMIQLSDSASLRGLQ